MSFRDNLQYLRSTRNLTQERLAMLLGVSRQAISKWESGKAYPEMDKLLMICDLFGCTLDDLVLGDVRHPKPAKASGGSPTIAAGRGDGGGGTFGGVYGTAAGNTDGTAVGGGTGAVFAAPDGSEPSMETASAGAGGNGVDGDGEFATGVSASSESSAAFPMDATTTTTAAAGISPMTVSEPEDLTGYDAHVRMFALKVALGIASIIAGVGIGVAFGGDALETGSLRAVASQAMGDFWMFVCIAIGVVVGLALIIPAGVAHEQFQRRHPYIEDFYTDDDHARASRRLAIGVVLGIGAILGGVATNIYGDEVLGIEDGWPVGVMLLCIAAGVFSIVYCGIRSGMMDIDEYNHDAEQERKEKKREAMGGDLYDKLTGVLCGIIMLVATVIGLLMLFNGFSSDGESHANLFWLSWPIGGLLCGVVAMALSMLREFREHDEARNGDREDGRGDGRGES